MYKNRQEEFKKKIFEKYPRITQVSEELRKLYLKMIQYKEDNRPKNVEEILQDLLFSDLKNFKNEDYIEYENMMKDLEKEVQQDNETVETKKTNEETNDINDNKSGTKSVKNNGEIYFDSKLRPKYLNISGLNAMNYTLINIII